jgi:phage terminase large subunit
VAWVEEAQTLSAVSLKLLRPTIRDAGSEIWFSWNPRRKSDPVDLFLRGAELPTDAIIVKANWNDNPWLPKELDQERLDDLRIDPEQYRHVWDGDYISIATGAYFAKVLAAARQEKRISRVGADPLMKFYAFWDIGGTGNKADACSIWIAQFIGKEIRVVNYYEAVGQELATHVNWLRDNGYSKALCVLPHDGAQHDKVYRVSYESSLKQAGFAAHVVPNQGLGAANQRIEAVRRIFPQCWFDAEKCSGGIDALGWYHEKRDESRNIGLGPEHDWSSHACDAMGLLAVAYEKLLKPRDTIRPNVLPSRPADSVAGY